MDDGTDESSGADKAYGWVLVVGVVLVALWAIPNILSYIQIAIVAGVILYALVGLYTTRNKK